MTFFQSLVKNSLTIVMMFFLSWALYAQDSFSAEQYREDLRYLQDKVHTDFPFLFKKTTAAEFDAEVEEFYTAIPEMEPHEVLVGFTKLVAGFEYGHTIFGWWDGIIPFHQIPVFLYQFDDGIYLHGVHKDYPDALGAKLLAIGNTPIEEALKKMRPVISAENEQFVKAYGLHFLTFPEFLHAQGVIENLNGELELTLEKDGKTFKKSIKALPNQRFPSRYGMVEPGTDWLDARDLSETPLYLKKLEKIYFYEYLPEHKTVYIRHSQIQDDSIQPIPEFYKEVFNFIEENDVDKLILDVRLNGGGNNYKNKPIVTGVIANKKINQSGKFFVIIGRRTFSACQNLVNELHTYTNAIFVGEPTSENINFYGDNHAVVLPNTKMKALLSFAWWQDKPQWENKPALYPQLATGLTFEQYITNQDPALKTALEYSDTGFISDPMRYFTELFTSGQADKIQPEAERMLEDPHYAFFEFEEEFNKAGYNLLGQQSYEEAIYVFQINTSLFPESANAWDSLAEAYWKAGNTSKAKELYNKAIELDPEGDIGKHAREMLLEIEKGASRD
ncbi:tetratricopeptide repeat protein [Muriicola sp. SD30]|uniref:tetratricopeptide repeat protein n=1 Tax=Muriicola sp. SD30 TaxID=3240936 RepID=UPI00350F7769